MNQLLKAIVSWVFLFGGVLVVMADVCLHLLPMALHDLLFLMVLSA
jgi:hypothetical protein